VAADGLVATARRLSKKGLAATTTDRQRCDHNEIAVGAPRRAASRVAVTSPRMSGSGRIWFLCFCVFAANIEANERAQPQARGLSPRTLISDLA
jgi:hypothetical protein